MDAYENEHQRHIKCGEALGKTHNKDCKTCMYEPEWEKGDIPHKDDNYGFGVCLYDEEPLVKVEGKFYVEGDLDGVCLLENCSNHE